MWKQAFSDLPPGMKAAAFSHSGKSLDFGSSADLTIVGLIVKRIPVLKRKRLGFVFRGIRTAAIVSESTRYDTP
jgi:hypothetical protein